MFPHLPKAERGEGAVSEGGLVPFWATTGKEHGFVPFWATTGKEHAQKEQFKTEFLNTFEANCPICDALEEQNDALEEQKKPKIPVPNSWDKNWGSLDVKDNETVVDAEVVVDPDLILNCCRTTHLTSPLKQVTWKKFERLDKDICNEIDLSAQALFGKISDSVKYIVYIRFFQTGNAMSKKEYAYKSNVRFRPENNVIVKVGSEYKIVEVQSCIRSTPKILKSVCRAADRASLNWLEGYIAGDDWDDD